MLERIRLVCLNSNKELTQKIAEILDVPVMDSVVTTFADGEILFEGKQSFRGDKVYVIQSTCPPVTERLMELLVCCDALKRASAKEINAIIPYFGYARQDRKAKARQPITARLVADLLQTAGVDRVVSTDLHAPQIHVLIRRDLSLQVAAQGLVLIKDPAHLGIELLQIEGHNGVDQEGTHHCHQGQDEQHHDHHQLHMHAAKHLRHPLSFQSGE